MGQQPKVVSSESLTWAQTEAGDLYASKRRRLSQAAGGQRLGCSMMEIEPGKTAWPFHYHLGNEEAMFVLSGEATLRLGDERQRVSAGDYVAFVAGQAGGHQVTNTGPEPFRYLMLSTMEAPDVVVYPDSNKLGVFAGRAPGGSVAHGPDVFTTFLRRDATVDYWDGETEPGTAPKGEQPGAASKQRLEQEIDSVRQRLLGGDASRSILDRMEAKFNQLRHAFAGPASDDADGSPPEPPKPETPDEEALERQIDDEIAQLKKKLGL